MTFPTHIDNTIRSSFFTCGMQAFYGHIRDLHPVGESVHLVAGGAFAAGLEVLRRGVYEQGLTQADALKRGQEEVARVYGDFTPPERSPKTRANMVEALAYYTDKFPLLSDSYRPRRMEWRFEVPIPGLVHPDTGGPIMYCGRPDTLGDIGDFDVVEDDKTATSLGKSWQNQWPLDSQFTGYRWAAQQLGLLRPNGNGAVLIRGISILSPKFDEVETTPELAGSHGGEVKWVERGRGKEKTSTPFNLVYTREGSFGHAQALVYRPQWMIDRWLRQLQRDVGRMIYAYMNDPDASKGLWDYALHKNACAAYGGCPYTTLCESEHPEKWIPLNYVVRKWDPMAVV